MLTQFSLDLPHDSAEGCSLILCQRRGLTFGVDEYQVDEFTRWDPEVVDPRAAALSPAPSRVRHPNFPKTTGAGVHVTSRRIRREFQLEFPQRLLETEPHDALREDMRLDKGRRQRLYPLLRSSMLHCSMLCKECLGSTVSRLHKFRKELVVHSMILFRSYATA